MTQSEQGNTVSAQLWAFVQETYALPGVAEQCLKLQDGYDMDVCLLLTVAWCAAEGRKLTTDEIAALDKHCEVWRSAVIEPLRRQRRDWKGSDEPWYQAAKKLELEAERLLLCEIATRSEVSGTPSSQVSVLSGLSALSPLDSRDAMAESIDALAAFAASRSEADALGLRSALAGFSELLDQSGAKNPPD